MRDMSEQLEAFVWKAGPEHRGPKLSYATGRCSYRLGDVAIDQCVAVTALTEAHLLFLFLSSAKPLEPLVLTQWAHILDAFEPDHGPLPLTSFRTPDEAEDGDDDEEE